MKIKKEDFYYIYILIMTIIFYFRFYNFNNIIINNIYLLATIFALISFFLYWIQKIYTLRERIIHICIILFVCIIYYLSGHEYEYLIFSTLAIIGIKDKSLKKIMKIFVLSYGICLGIHFILLGVGVFKDIVYTKISSGRKIDIHSLDFTTGNSFFAILFIFYSAIIYSYYDKIKPGILLLMEFLAILLYNVFYSRTGIVCISILIIGTSINKYVKINKYIRKIISSVEIIIIPLMFLITLLFSTIFFATDMQKILDKVISSRLIISHIYIEKYPISLFQMNFEYIGDLPLDNLYSFIMCAFGMIPTMIINVCYIRLMVMLLKNKKYFEMFYILIFAIYSYSEKMFINVFRNPSILMLGIILYDNFNFLNIGEKNE